MVRLLSSASPAIIYEPSRSEGGKEVGIAKIRWRLITALLSLAVTLAVTASVAVSHASSPPVSEIWPNGPTQIVDEIWPN